MRRRVLLGALATLPVGCGPRRLPAPPDAPRVVSASDLIPPDLDVIARLDMAKMKATLGALTPQLLSREVLARGNSDGEAPEELVVESLLEADVAYLGYRPSPLLLPLDRVLALQGRFTAITKTPVGFQGRVDLGADLRYWDRRTTKPLARSASARFYAAGSRVRAFVSEAELDAVERALERLGEPRPLSAPEEGALSLAARPQVLSRLVSGTLRDLLQESKSLEVVVDLESDFASLRASLQTSSAEHAEQLASAGEAVIHSALRDYASRAKLQAVEGRVSLTLRVSREELAALVARSGGR
jgi:hypothetical protein